MKKELNEGDRIDTVLEPVKPPNDDGNTDSKAKVVEVSNESGNLKSGRSAKKMRKDVKLLEESSCSSTNEHQVEMTFALGNFDESNIVKLTNQTEKEEDVNESIDENPFSAESEAEVHIQNLLSNSTPKRKTKIITEVVDK